MEKAGNQSIRQLLKGNVQQPKKLMLGEEKRENATNSGINGHNQLRINVQEREKGNKSNSTCCINSLRDDMTMR